MTKWYAITKTIDISSIDRCVPYKLILLLTKEHKNIGMACKWNVGVYFTERDQLWSTLLSRVTLKGYGYKYLSDLRSPRWLASNLLYFSVKLPEFLIQDRKIFGHNQVLVKSICELRWNWSLQEIGENTLYFNLVRPWLGQSLWEVTGFIRLKYIMIVLLRVDSLTFKSS